MKENQSKGIILSLWGGGADGHGTGPYSPLLDNLELEAGK